MPEALLVQRHAGQRVLVADDNPICQDVVAELLRAVGLQVDVADNGAQALGMAAVHAYDLVLMDVQMPVLAGLCAARTLRERSDRGPPIVAMTVNEVDSERDVCLAAGMCDLLPKPVSAQSLYACLLRWLPPTEVSAATFARDRAPAVEATRPPPSGLHARLSGVDGFEVARVMGNLGGSLALLERTIGKFVKTYRDGVPELAGANRPDEMQAWRRACHALRGATVMVGATALQREIADFEAALNASLSAVELQARARLLDQCVVRLASRLESALEAES